MSSHVIRTHAARVSSSQTLVAACGLLWSVLSAAASAGSAPSQYFDLSHWKLTIPVDASGGTSGEAVDLPASTLTGGYSSQWFSMSASGKAVEFWAPVNGASTDGSHYPRSELRELLDPSDDNVNWTVAGQSVLQAKCKVMQVPSSTGKVVVGQIHGFQTAPLVKLVYAYSTTANTGSVYALINPTPDSTTTTKLALASNIALGQAFSYEIDVSAGALTMWVDSNAMASYTVNAQWNGIGMYYKAGDYVQASGSSSTDGGRVAFYRFIATHPDNGLSITTRSLDTASSYDWYSRQLDSSGGVGAGSWTVVNGVLPAGLSLSSSGVLSGTPAAVSASTTYYFSVMVTDEQNDTAARNYALTVTPGP